LCTEGCPPLRGEPPAGRSPPPAAIVSGSRRVWPGVRPRRKSVTGVGRKALSAASLSGTGPRLLGLTLLGDVRFRGGSRAHPLLPCLRRLRRAGRESRSRVERRDRARGRDRGGRQRAVRRARGGRAGLLQAAGGALPTAFRGPSTSRLTAPLVYHLGLAAPRARLSQKELAPQHRRGARLRAGRRPAAANRLRPRS
jgi:hypothetical protein